MLGFFSSLFSLLELPPNNNLAKLISGSAEVNVSFFPIFWFVLLTPKIK